MAGVLDVLELMKVLPGVTLPYSSEGDCTNWILIPVNCDTIKNDKIDTVAIHLKGDPFICCHFRVEYSEECGGILRASIKFMSKGPYTDLKYKASLYVKNPGGVRFDFLGDLNIENINEGSVFYFPCPNDKGFRPYCYFLCQISRQVHNFTPMKFDVPNSQITKDLSLLYKNQLHADVKIVCQDQEFPAHKLVLIARSPVFQAMFDHKMKESEENEIKITDIEPEILDNLLGFMYTDTVKDLKEGQAEKLLAAANKYALESLKLICMNEIAKSVEGVLEAFNLLAIAERYNVSGLGDIVLDFVRKNAKK